MGFEELLNTRISRLDEWLKEHAPHVFDEQVHLDTDTEERSYWHYGYLIALRDVQKMIGDTL
jgi:hypothetical protein